MNQPQPTLTEQQQAALGTRDVSVALAAGAGCGKTSVLTRRLLQELEPADGDAPAADGGLGGVVAITFTERAAREMRDRIRSECERRLRECPAEQRQHWLSILRSIDTARVGTIHSFCAALLRTHAVEAALDPQFTVLEAADARALLRRVATATVHELLAGRDADVIHLVLHYGLERTIDLLVRLVGGRFHGGPASALDPAARAADWLELWRREFVPLVLQELQESPVVQRAIDLLQDNVPLHDGMRSRCETLLQELSDLTAAPDPVAALQSCREAAQVKGGGGKSAWDSDEVYADVRDAFAALRKSIDAALADLDVPEEDVHRAAEFSVIAERVLQPLLDAYEQRKGDLGALDFDDLLLKALRLLQDHPPVRKAAAAGIDFLMVDEFQDTDPVQAEIVQLLCGERLLTGKLFLVGDAQQSIYRFRRADPRVFASLRNKVPEAGRLPLSRNFRSQPAILSFANCLFAQAMGPDYEPLVPHAAQLSPQPCVEFLFARSSAADDSPDADDGRADQPTGGALSDSAEDRRKREADWLARRLARLLKDPTPRIRDRDPQTGEVVLRAARPGDVAILFRTLSNVALYENALREQGIDYYLVGGRAFYAQQEVHDLMNLLSCLDDPDDEVALAGVLRSPLFSLTDETLFAVTEAAGSLYAALEHARTPEVRGRKTNPQSAIGAPATAGHPQSPALTAQQQRQWRFAGDVLNAMRNLKDRVPLAELLQRFLDRTGYDAVLLTEFLGRRKLANLEKLIDLARQFDRAGLMTPAEFVERLRESVTEQTDEELAATHAETSDVVRLMTIHQSKGLEFPVVALADMDWTRGGGSRPAHFHERLGPLFPLPAEGGERPKHLGQTMHRLQDRREDDAEAIRVLYVAVTRAADHLILSSGLRDDGRVSSLWLKLLSERFDLQTGLPRGDAHSEKPKAERGKPTPHSPPAEIPEILVHHTRPEPAGQSTEGTARKAETTHHSQLAAPRRLPLEEFRRAVETAEPLPLPPTYVRIGPRIVRRIDVTVTELVAADRTRPEIRNRPSTTHHSPPTTSDSTADVDARLLGTVLHRAIERIDDLQGRNAEPFVEAIAASAGVQMTPDLRRAAAKRLKAFLGSPFAAELSRAEICHRELDFVLQRDVGGRRSEGGGQRAEGGGRRGEGESAICATHHSPLTTHHSPHADLTTVAIHGQIDCLFRSADGRWTLADFKTGRLEAYRPDSIVEDYAVQLAVYADAAALLIGGMPDVVGLLHLDERAEFFPLPFSAARRKRLDTRVAEALDAVIGPFFTDQRIDGESAARPG